MDPVLALTDFKEWKVVLSRIDTLRLKDRSRVETCIRALMAASK